MIVFFSLFLPLVGGDERGPPIVIEGQDEVADLDTFFQTFTNIVAKRDPFLNKVSYLSPLRW